jgi:MtrB/PioB family decaheme-associated outer membrane protein
MNAGTGTIGLDLPLNSRYMGTVTFSEMNQNAQFLPFSSNPAVLIGGVPATSLSLLPAQSLNGQINTLLVNNVLTTQINPNLKTKLSYRYYDYDNQTPQIGTITTFVPTDAATLTAAVNPLLLGYKKQNGSAEVDWRPVNTVNVGSAYNFERYDFTRFDAQSTTENGAKIFADYKPANWVTFRTSANYGERRASGYDYFGNVGRFQWPTGTTGGELYTPYYRQFFLDDRNRTQARFQVDVDVLRNLTVSPNVKWSDDEYLLQQNQVGLTHDRALGAGVDVAYAPTSDLRFLVSYMNEQHNQFTWGTGTTLAPYTATQAYTGTNLYGADINDRVNTIVLGVQYAVIPTRFELGLNYTWAFSTNTSPLVFGNGTTPTSPAAGISPALQFPEVSTNYQRVDATAKYVIDPGYTHSLGIPGQVALKLRYAWERNSVTNWNNDMMTPYLATTALFAASSVGYMQMLASDNPNYNVHMLAGTVSWAW